MTMFNSNLVLDRIVKSPKCPRCCEPKPIGNVFCTNCLEKLPTDLASDLNEKDTYTRVVAYADATQFLMNEWR
jgi:hypothetical protein